MARSASPALGKGVVCLSALSAVHARRDVEVPPQKPLGEPLLHVLDRFPPGGCAIALAERSLAPRQDWAQGPAMSRAATSGPIVEPVSPEWSCHRSIQRQVQPFRQKVPTSCAAKVATTGGWRSLAKPSIIHQREKSPRNWAGPYARVLRLRRRISCGRAPLPSHSTRTSSIIPS